MVEDHRQVAWAAFALEFLHELPEHRGEPVHRADGGALRVRERGELVVGAEDVARAVDEIEVVGHDPACSAPG